jgi:hypothetical protein
MAASWAERCDSTLHEYADASRATWLTGNAGPDRACGSGPWPGCGWSGPAAGGLCLVLGSFLDGDVETEGLELADVVEDLAVAANAVVVVVRAEDRRRCVPRTCWAYPDNRQKTLEG